MDKLEKYIHENRAAFDTNEAPAFDSFTNKQTKNIVRKNLNQLWYGIGIAATIILIFGLGFYLGHLNQSTEQIHLADLQQMYPEYAQAEKYYTQKIEDELKTLNKKDLEKWGVEPSFYEELKLENETYHTLYKSLNENPNNEQVAIAIIAYYQSKLELLTALKTEMNIAKNNINKYEK